MTQDTDYVSRVYKSSSRDTIDASVVAESAWKCSGIAVVFIKCELFLLELELKNPKSMYCNFFIYCIIMQYIP